MERVKIESKSLIKTLIENKSRLLHLTKTELSKKYGISYSTLKRWLRLECTIPKDIFNDLLNEYPEKETILKEVQILKSSWGQIKGGKNSVKARIKKWGNEKFLKQLELARNKRRRNSLLLWYKKIKLNKKMYKKFKELRRKHVLKILASKKIRSKVMKTLIKKYGNYYFKMLGTLGAKNSPLTEREKKIVKENLKANIPFDVHVPIGGWCVDFHYRNNFVEEVLGFRKSKALLFYEIAKIFEKRKKIKKEFIVTSWFVKKYTYKKERFPIEATLLLIENNIIPILLDITQLRKLRTKILQGKMKNFKRFLSNFYARLINKNSLRGALIEKKKPLDKLEKNIQNILEKNNLHPKGKTILETKYGTYIVSDNFFNSTAVFVSEKNIKSLIGYGFMIKNLVSKKIKVIGITNKKIKICGVDKYLIKQYIDLFFPTIKEFKEWASGAMVARRFG